MEAALLDKAKEFAQLNSYSARNQEQEVYQLYRDIFEMEPCTGCGANRLNNTLNSLRDFVKRQENSLTTIMASKKSSYRFKAGFERSAVVLPEEGRVIDKSNLTDEDAKFLLEQDQYKHLVEKIPASAEEESSEGENESKDEIIARLQAQVTELSKQLTEATERQIGTQQEPSEQPGDALQADEQATTRRKKSNS